MDRQRRFEVNSLRRSRDWFALDIPTFILWMGDDYLDPDDEW